MTMTSNRLLHHIDGDGVGVSNGRKSKNNTACLLRLPSYPQLCDVFSNGVPTGLITITLEVDGYMWKFVRREHGLTSSEPPRNRRKISVCEEARSSIHLTPVAGVRTVSVSEPKPELYLSKRIQLSPSSDGIKTNFASFTIEYDSWGIQRLRREYCTWEDVVGLRVQHTVPNTCALDAAAMCVEAQHRRVYERLHGRGSFPCRAAAPRALRRACRRENEWSRQDGAPAIGPVLERVKSIGGIRTTNAPPPAPSLLPLSSWERHLPDGMDGKFTEDRVADLMDENGPSIGTFRVTDWYVDVDADVDDEKVYRSDVMPAISMNPFVNMFAALLQIAIRRSKIVLHAVVICGYRNRDTGMHVLVLDNRRRWVHRQEFLEIYTLQVQPMDPRLFAGRNIRYPLTGA